MHVERLTKLAEWLEGGAKHKKIIFNMRTGITFNQVVYRNPEKTVACGSSCCIAGAAVQFFNDPVALTHEAMVHGDLCDQNDKCLAWSTVKSEARDLLGLSYEEALDLFEPAYSCRVETVGRWRLLDDYNDPLWAARTIRRFIKTGEVNWVATYIPEEETC